MNTFARQTRINRGTALAVVALVCAVAITVAVAASAAATNAPAPTRALRFVSKTTRFTPIGFPADQKTPPPIGSRYIVQIALFNQAAQFGKAAGAQVGSGELDCTFTTSTRSLCNGVAHLPDGYLTFTGANPSNGATIERYAVTGGISAYANLRGQIKATNSQNGNRANVTINLH